MSAVLPPGQRAGLDQAHRTVGDMLDKMIVAFRGDLSLGMDPVEAAAALTYRLTAAKGSVTAAYPGLLAVAVERLARKEQGGV